MMGLGLGRTHTLFSISVYLTLLHTCILGSHAVVFQHISEVSTTVYDFVVVGGGAGGAVVANRLIENPKIHVLLIEAGPTNEGVMNAIIPSLYRSLQKTTYDWNYTTVPTPAVNNRSLDYWKGFILGGSTSHNGMYYTRGSMDDYNRWAEVTGDEGWAWKNLLPYILKTEKLTPPSDLHDTRGQITPSLHGKDGLVFTSLPSNPETIDGMVINATRELGGLFPFVEDYNSGKPMGLGWLQATMGNGSRSSAATAFLSETFTRRPNLSVLLNTKVARVLGTSKGSHVTFNAVEIQGSTTKFTAKKEIILSAGTVNTPQILMSSGVGDRDELQKLNRQFAWSHEEPPVAKR